MVVNRILSAFFNNAFNTLLLSFCVRPFDAGSKRYASSIKSVPPSASCTILENASTGWLSPKISSALVNTGVAFFRYLSSLIALDRSSATVLFPVPGFPMNVKLHEVQVRRSLGGFRSTVKQTSLALRLTSLRPVRFIRASMEADTNPYSAFAFCQSVSGSFGPSGGNKSE